VRDFCAWQASVRVADRSMLSALTYLIGILAAASVVVYAAYTRGHEVLASLSFLAYWSQREREKRERERERERELRAASLGMWLPHAPRRVYIVHRTRVCV